MTILLVCIIEIIWFSSEYMSLVRLVSVWLRFVWSISLPVVEAAQNKIDNLSFIPPIFPQLHTELSLESRIYRPRLRTLNLVGCKLYGHFFWFCRCSMQRNHNLWAADIPRSLNTFFILHGILLHWS